MNNAEETKFEKWAIIELMGRNMIAGFVTEQVIGGSAMLRVDVPGTPNQAAFTKFFGGAAVYAITPTTQEIATAAAQKLTIRPVQEWVVPDPHRQLVDSQSNYDYAEQDDYDHDDE